jgi:putative colanic acid biosynthesis acetyltransferase WcaF
MYETTPKGTSPHTMSNRLRRALWGVVYLVLIRPSPRFAHRWRNWIYRLMGARIHPTARIYPTARVWAPWNITMGEMACLGDLTDIYSVDMVTLGAHATVSQYAFLCTASHDIDKPNHPLTTAPITLGEDAWIAADVFVAPGVTIPDGVVVGARSSVFKSDLPAWHFCAGTPARPIRPRSPAASAARHGRAHEHDNQPHHDPVPMETR